VLPALVVEATQADAVGRLVVAAARTVADVMDFKVAPRGAAGRRAAPAVANVDLVARAARCHDGDAFDDVRTGERSDARLNCSDRATELPMRETLNSGRDFPGSALRPGPAGLPEILHASIRDSPDGGDPGDRRIFALATGAVRRIHAHAHRACLYFRRKEVRR